MGKKSSRNIPRENLGDKKDAIEAYFGAPKRAISAKVAPVPEPAVPEPADTAKEQTEIVSREETAARIALIGDSIGKGISGAIKKISSQHKVVAVGGARLQEGSKKYREISTSQLQEIDPKKTPYLVIQGGTNDLNNNPPEVVAKRLKELYQKANKMGFEKVVIVTIPPHKKESYTQKVLDTNAILREMAKKGEIVIYDLYEDYVKKDPNLKGIGNNSVHPNHKGCEILGNLIVGSFAKKAPTSGSYSAEVASNLAAGTAAAAAETGVETATLPPETVAPAPTSTEHQTPESQALQKALQAELEKLAQNKETRKKDEETIKAASIKDIRFNTALLNGDENKVQEEMRRRLAQYTDRQSDGGLRLNYMKFNQLTGVDHEMGIGLGDVMPPEYTRILVVTLDGRYRLGKRDIVPHKGVQRVGYMDEATGEYLATYSDDVAYVLNPPLTDKAKLDALLAQEKQARTDGKTSYAAYKQTDYYGTSSGEETERTYSDGKTRENLRGRENRSLKDLTISKLDQNIQGRKFWSYKNLEIKDPATGELIWKYNKEASEGTNIHDFSVAVCRYYKMEDMVPAIWGIVGAESTFNPFNKNPKSAATGLGQPMRSTWETFIPTAKSSRDPFASKIMAGQYGVGVEYPDSQGTRQVNLSRYRFPPEKDYLNYSRCNPYLNIYFTVLNTKKSIERYKSEAGIDIRKLETREQLRLLYTMHHDGHAGGIAMLKFIKRLEFLGINTKDRTAVNSFLRSGSPEANTALSILCGDRNGGGSSQEHRARTDTDRFLNTWYSTSQVAARYAMIGGGIEEKETVASASPESPDIDRNKEELSTTELLQIFKSGNKEKIDRIIAQYGYPSLREIENQLKDVPPGKFEEDPTGVVADIDPGNNEILLTFDICSNYQGDNEKNVLDFINNVMSKRPPVPVILFVTGNALSNPRIRSTIEEAARYPHISIQNHGYAHRPLCTAPGREKPYGIIPTSGIEEAYYEVVKGAILIQSTTGKKPEFYRSSTLYADPRGVRLAEILGLKTLGRTNDTGDHQELGEERAGNIVLRHAIKPSSIAFVENMRARIQKQEIKPTLNIA